MPTKKKKYKQIRQVSVAELIEDAQGEMARGQFDQALGDLRAAQSELKRYRPSNGDKKISIPPHIVVAQKALPLLLARALFAHSFTVSDRAAKLAEVEEAAKLAPEDARYTLARGALQLMSGDIESARADFQSAHERQPADDLTARAQNLLAASERDDLSAASGFSAQLSSSLKAGLQQLAAGETEAAEKSLTALPQLEHNPTRAEAASLATQFFYSGALRFSAKEFQAAVTDFNEAGRMATAHTLSLPWVDRLTIYYHQVAESLAGSDLHTAIQCWEKIVGLVPGDKIALHNLLLAKSARAYLAWEAGKTEEAARVWQEALVAAPSDEKLLRNLGVASEKLGRKPEAITHWRALARLWRQQAKARSGDAEFKTRLIKLEQHVVTLMLETGADGEQIVNELESALKLDPDNQALRMATAEQLMEVGRAKQALKHLEMVEKQQGVSVDLLVRKGVALDLMHRTGDARRTLEQAYQLDPSNPLARRSYLIFLDQQIRDTDEDGEAIEICLRQLEIDPAHDPALTYLAGIYLNEGRKDKAREMLDRLIASDPQSAKKHVAAGFVYLNFGVKKDAEVFFKKALQLDPSEKTILEIGMSYLQADEIKQALKYFDRIIDSADVDALLEVAVHLVEEGKMKDADRYLKKAMERDPSNPMPHLIRAISLIGGPFSLLPKVKDLNEAKQEFAEAERLMVGNPKYERILPELSMMKRLIEGGPLAMGGPFGGPGGRFIPIEDDFFFDDNPFESGPYKPKKKKKR